MRSIPSQSAQPSRLMHRETARPAVSSVVRTGLPGDPFTPAAARRFARAALDEWADTVPLDLTVADDAVLVVSELVTNAVVHAGTAVELVVRLAEDAEDAPAAVVVEVSDHHPTRTVAGRDPAGTAHGGGLHLVAAVCECWGVTYRPGLKTVWARVPLDGRGPGPHHPPGQPGRRPVVPFAPDSTAEAAVGHPYDEDDTDTDRDWDGRSALSFLAESSELLAGQLDEDMVAALAGQLLVPRVAHWSALWLDPEGTGPVAGTGPRPGGVWHIDESATERLRNALSKEAPQVPDPTRTGAVPVPWPYDADTETGSALAYPLVAGGRGLGTLMIGRRGPHPVPSGVTTLVEDFARRVALAIGAARRYARQATISRVLQRGLLPSQVARIPGVDSHVVYEPSDDSVAGGDFYDIFPAGGIGDRWGFMLGDVQGSGPEAAVVTGLARPWLRLLAREEHQVGEVLDRLNGLLLDDATEAAEAAALMAAAAGGQDVPDRPQPRFLSLLYGEITPLGADGGAHCTVACAGHPLPLLLRPDGTVRQVAEPQILLGVVGDVAYESHTFDLEPGDTLLCVTDGVTERRSGGRMFDDGDGLERALADCAGLTAEQTADRIRQAVHAFGDAPVGDDLALLVLQARRPGEG